MIKKVLKGILAGAAMMLVAVTGIGAQEVHAEPELVRDVNASVDLGSITANTKMEGAVFHQVVDEVTDEISYEYDKDPFEFTCGDGRVSFDRDSGYWDYKTSGDYKGKMVIDEEEWVFEEGKTYRYVVTLNVNDSSAYKVNRNTHVYVNGQQWTVLRAPVDEKSIVIASPDYAIVFPHYNVWLGNVQVNSANKDNIPSVIGGTASYDPDTKTLTLNGISGVAGLKDGYQVNSYGDLTIKGSGSLINHKAAYGIKVGANGYSSKTLTIDANLNVYGSEYGLYGVNSAAINLAGGNCEIEGGARAVYGGSVTLGNAVDIKTPENSNVNYGTIMDGSDPAKKVVYETDASGITKYKVWVGGVRITSENADNVPGVEGGTAVYDAASNALIFNDVTGISGSYNDSLIYAQQDLYLYGNATMRNTGVAKGIHLGSGNLYIKGNIDVEAAEYGIYVENGFFSLNKSYATNSPSGVTLPDNLLDVVVKGGNYGIKAKDKISVGKCYVKASATGSSGIAAASDTRFEIAQNGYLVAESAGDVAVYSGKFVEIGNPAALVLSGKTQALDLRTGSGGYYAGGSGIEVLYPEGGSVYTNSTVGYVVDSGNNKAPFAIIGPSDGVSIVTFDMNGHGDKTLGSRYAMKGKEVVKPADPTSADGMTFEGWCTDPAGTSSFNFKSGVQADTTIYAKWSGTPITDPEPDPGSDSSSNSGKTTSTSTSAGGESDTRKTTSTSTSAGGGSDTGKTTSTSTSAGGESDTRKTTSTSAGAGGGSDTRKTTSTSTGAGGGSDTRKTTSTSTAAGGGSDTRKTTSTSTSTSSAGGGSDSRKSDDSSTGSGSDSRKSDDSSTGSGSDSRKSDDSSTGSGSDSRKSDDSSTEGGSDTRKTDGSSSAADGGSEEVSGNLIPADPEKKQTKYESKDEDKKSADGAMYDVEVELENNTYDGTKKKPVIKVYDNNGKELKSGIDYKVSFKNNKDANTVYDETAGGFKAVPGKTPTYIVKFKGEYKNSKQIMGTFNINPYPISFAMIEPKKDTIAAKEMRSFKFIKKITVNFNGKDKKLSIAKDIDPLTMRIRCMDPGENFGKEFTMKDNAKAPAGKYIIVVDGKGNFYHSKEDGGFRLERVQ